MRYTDRPAGLEAQERAAALSKARHDRALEVDLPIQRHKQLNSLHPAIGGRNRCPIVHNLVGKIFNCVAKDLKRMPRLGSNAAALHGDWRSGCRS